MLAPITEALAQSVLVRAEVRPVVDRIIVPGRVAPAASSDVVVGRNMVVEKFLVVPGERVKKGQKMAEIDVKSVAYELGYLRPYVDYSQRNLQVAEIDLKVADERLERISILASKGIVSDSDLDSAKEGASSARRNHERAMAQLAEWQSKLAEVNQRLREVALVSPRNGVVAEMIIDPRNFFGVYQARAGTVLARVDEPGKYQLDVKMNDRDFLRLGEFPVCEVILPYTAPIRCTVIPPSGVPERSDRSVSALFPVTVRFDYGGRTSAKQGLVKGLEGSLRLSAAKPVKRLLIPWNAVDVEPGKTYVQVQGSAGSKRTEVKLGWRDGHHVEVLSGLKSGDSVIAKVWPPARNRS